MHIIAYIYISITTTITRVELSKLTLSGEYTAQSTEPNRKIGHRNRRQQIEWQEYEDSISKILTIIAIESFIRVEDNDALDRFSFI